MKKTHVNIEILHYVSLLEKSSQSKVLSYIKSLFKASSPKKNNNKEILQFAGAFSNDDLLEINNAISEGCEKPDLNEW